MKKRNRSGPDVGGSSAAIKYNKTVNKVLLPCQISQRFVQNKISRAATIDRKRLGEIWCNLAIPRDLNGNWFVRDLKTTEKEIVT